MTKEAKMMINMAMSMAEVNGWTIERMDLQKNNTMDIKWYHLDVWFDNGKEITIREDCTVYTH